MRRDLISRGRLARQCLAALSAAAAAIPLAIVHADAAELPPATDNYASELKAVLSSSGRTSLQALFELALKASPGVEAVLPEMTDGEFKSVPQKMRGFIVRRDDTPVARPSSAYFAALARRKGTATDRVFFEIYARSEPDSSPILPAYIRQQSAESGCTMYDGKLMTELYRGWLAFRTKYPDDYANEAEGEIDSLDAELLSGICACGSAEQTAAGLQTFVDALPDLPMTPKLKDRIAQIRSGHSSFRFNCKSG